MLGRHLLRGGKKVPIGTVWDFTGSAIFEVPASGNYKITLVGAGGKGGNGSSATTCKGPNNVGNISSRSVSGSGGGGGGSGQTVTQTYSLKSKNKLSIIVGASNGAATKITGAVTLTANGGSAGVNGNTNPNYPDTSTPACNTPGPNSGYGGSGGTLYNPGTSGGNSESCGGPSAGGTGGVSAFGGNVGRGGNGGGGKGSGCSGNTSGPWNGSNGYPGICRIEYLGR